MSNSVRVLFLGDIVGNVGIKMVERWLGHLKAQYKVDCVIINGENAGANGRGPSDRSIRKILELGADAVTSGNHIWDQKDIYNYINEEKRLIRPANYPAGTPGNGMAYIEIAGVRICVMNLMGRVFLRETLDCPFKKADDLLVTIRQKTPIVLVDFHAETTSEKQALGLYLDGRISAMVGTHTHTMTADEKILPKGTAYITDLGFSGSKYSCLGMQSDSIIKRFITQMPQKFIVDTTPPYVLSGVCIDINTRTGMANSIERVQIEDNNKIEG